MDIGAGFEILIRELVELIFKVTGFEKGLKRMVEWFNENKGWIELGKVKEGSFRNFLK